MSSAYHPKTNGAVKCTNKIVNQILCYHVDQQQKKWVKALSTIYFYIMNIVNISTGYSFFQLCSGFSLWLISFLIKVIQDTKEASKASQILEQLQNNIKNAQDSLMTTKIQQVHHANSYCTVEDIYQKRDIVILSTRNYHLEYKFRGNKYSAKFMPRYDRPWKVIKAFPELEYTLELLNSGNIFSSIHISQLCCFQPNNPSLFSSQCYNQCLLETTWT